MKKIIDYDDYFEEYMGLVYSKIIKSYDMDIKTVVEFAPGFRYKIAYALKKINFKGTIYIIDSNKNVISFVKKKYKSILPESKIVTISKDLSEAIKIIPKKIDLFVANHSIDDMIISKYLDENKLKKAFDNTEESKQILIDCWNTLREEDNLLLDINTRVLNDFIKLFESIQFKLIVMSQYKSAYYMNQKNYIEDLSKKIFDDLKKRIDIDEERLKESLAFEFADFDAALNEGFSLKENIQYYDNWCVGKYIGKR